MRKFGVIGHLPGPGSGGVTQRLSIGFSIGKLVIANARTEFKPQAVHRTVEDLTTITRRQDITLLIAIIAVGQPAPLTKDIVHIGQVVAATPTDCIFF